MTKTLVSVMAGIALAATVARGADTPVDQMQDEARRQLRADAAREAEQLLAKNLLTQSMARAQDTTDLFGRLQAKAEVFLPRLSKLMTDDDGKRLAMDDSAFAQLMVVQQQPPATLE